jgi:flagellar motor switch protein FliG
MNQDLQFDQLVTLSDRTIQKILMETDSNDLALSLNASSDELHEKIFRNMTDNAIPLIKELIENLSKSPLEEIVASQERILAIWRSLEEAAEIERE